MTTARVATSSSWVRFPDKPVYDWRCFTCGASANGYVSVDAVTQAADEHRRTCPSSQGATEVTP